MTEGKKSVELLKDRIAGNARQALQLAKKKNKLEEAKRILLSELKHLKDNIVKMETFVEAYEFTAAIDLCDECIKKTTEHDPLSLTSKLTVIDKLKHHFEDFRSRKMAFYLQQSLSSLFEKQASFDCSTALYDKLIAGYNKLYEGSCD